MLYNEWEANQILFVEPKIPKIVACGGLKTLNSALDQTILIEFAPEGREKIGSHLTSFPRISPTSISFLRNYLRSGEETMIW